MNDLLLYLSLSLSGSVIALVLLLLKPLLSKFSKTWHYYIWILVLLRLLIPFTPDSNMIGTLFTQSATPRITPTAPDLPSEMVTSPSASNKEDLTLPEHTSPMATEGASNDSLNANITPFSASEYTFGAILFIAILLFFRKLYQYIQFTTVIKSESKEVFNEQLTLVLQKLCTSMKIKKIIPIYSNPFLRSPMLVGFFWPRIVVPPEALMSNEITYILQHELTHYLRRDFLYKWLAEFAVCLYWFNPVIYLVRRQINQNCELSCDESVISHLGVSEQLHYGEALLNAISIHNLSNKKIVSLSLGEDGKLLKRRLTSIMNYQRRSKSILFLTILLTAMLICGTVYVGSYAATPEKSVTKDDSISPIKISNKSLASGGKISLGEKKLPTGTTVNVSLTFKEKQTLTALCIAENDTQKEYSVKSGTPVSFTIKEGGNYTIAIKNQSGKKVSGIKGSITFSSSAKNTLSKPIPTKNPEVTKKPEVTKQEEKEQTIVYEAVALNRPSKGEDAYPYVHDIRKNNTEKTIIATERGMLAFDKNGKPLIIDWYGTDSESKPSYYFLDDWNSTKILPNKTYNDKGGWTLDFFGKDKNVSKIAYVLYCDKKITFSDGTVWNNPDFDEWYKTYYKKTIDKDVLDSYYPYVQTIQ